VDLSTSYLGLALQSPLVASPSPLTRDPAWIARVEEAGAGAVILPSLFEEVVEHEARELQRLEEHGAGAFAEAADGYLPPIEPPPSAADERVRDVEAAKRAVTIPVIASLNGTTPGGWVRYAKRLQDAGADALELNLYFVPSDPEASSASVEARYLEVVSAVKAEIELPLAVKLGPFFSALPCFARRLGEAGADALVLFNRFYQAEIDLDSLSVVPDLHLSSSAELQLPLRWIAILHGKVDAELALTTGVHRAEDALKGLLAGARVVMMTSALLRHGPEHAGEVLEGMRAWLDEREYASIDQLRGSMSLERVPDPAAYLRANYIRALVSFTPPPVRSR
jgi:dihydroorotate dehydrogenase (fumarate)